LEEAQSTTFPSASVNCKSPAICPFDVANCNNNTNMYIHQACRWLLIISMFGFTFATNICRYIPRVAEIVALEWWAQHRLSACQVNPGCQTELDLGRTDLCPAQNKHSELAIFSINVASTMVLCHRWLEIWIFISGNERLYIELNEVNKPLHPCTNPEIFVKIGSLASEKQMLECWPLKIDKKYRKVCRAG